MKAKVFILALFSVFVLTSCSPSTHDDEHSSKAKILHNIDPDQPRVEQEITVVFEVPSTITMQQGRVEGVNMYMGYMPVQVEAVSATQWRAKLWLGACAEPRMQWRVSIPWQNDSADEQGVYQFDFYTETN